MFASTLSAYLVLLAVAQQPTYTRVSVDRNLQYVDSVWTRSDSSGSSVYYQRGGDTSTTPVYTGTSPDVDVDDNGNYVIVFQATDPDNTGDSAVFLAVNGGTAVKVYSGSLPHVTISRSGGYIALTWMQGSGGTLTGPVLAATYRFNSSTNVFTQTTSPFTVNSSSSNTVTYHAGDISSDSSGNYVIAYACDSGSSGYGGGSNAGGVLAARYTVNTGTAIFSETTVASGDTASWYGSGAYHYSTVQVASWSNGESVVAYNVGSGYIYAVHIDGSATNVSKITIASPSHCRNILPISYTAYYANNLGVACLRSTPGKYVVTWGTTSDYNSPDSGMTGGSNLIYNQVDDQANPISTSTIFVTSITQGNTQNPGFNFAPGVSASDSPAKFVIDWNWQAPSSTVSVNEQQTISF